MNKISTTLAALMMTASVGALAQTTTDSTRDQRMNAALQDYRGGSTSANGSMHDGSMHDGSMNNGSMRDGSMHHGRKAPTNMHREGRMDRTEDSVESGGRKAGHAIAEGSRDAGHAVAQGARKTGHAIHKATDKAMGDKPDSTTP